MAAGPAPALRLILGQEGDWPGCSRGLPTGRPPVAISTMAITERTRKILWSRSAGRCAICKRELVTDETEADEEAVIGEECHIAAREASGPRGDSPLALEQRDEGNNLILLCRNHHKEIDDQPNTFTVEELRQIKARHLSWVRNSLKGRKSPSGAFFFAFRVDSGKQFCESVLSADAFHFSNDQPQTLEEAHLLGDFSQAVQDHLDLWNIMSSKDRVFAQFEFGSQIKELQQSGFLVYVVSRTQLWRSQATEQPLDLDVAYVFVVRPTNPLTVRKDDEVEGSMRLAEQVESQFTNFIPAMLGDCAAQLI
jgi:hypothetical protein